MRIPKLVPLSQAAMYEMYIGLVKGGYRGFSAVDLAKILDDKVSAEYAQRALELVFDGGFIAVSFQVDINARHQLNRKGIQEVETRLGDLEHFISKYAQYGKSLLFDIGIDIPDANAESPLEGLGSWQPLPIDRNSLNFKEAIAAIEEAIKEVAQSNGYAASEPEERDSILATLKTGLEALKQEGTIKSSLELLLMRPLKFLKAKFPEAALGVAAQKAIEWLLKILGLGS